MSVGATLSLPEIDFVPLQPPDAVQLVAFVVFQESALDCPLVIEDGAADKATIGCGVVAETVTVADCETVPPGPVHVIVYVVVTVGATDAVPEIAVEPLHPFEAVQLVVFVEDQVSVVD